MKEMVSDYYAAIEEVINKFPNQKVKTAALEKLKELKDKNLSLNGKPSASAGALLYYSRGNEKVQQKEVAFFLRQLNFVATEVTVRRLYRRLCELDDIPAVDKPQPTTNA